MEDGVLHQVSQSFPAMHDTVGLLKSTISLDKLAMFASKYFTEFGALAELYQLCDTARASEAARTVNQLVFQYQISKIF